MACGQCGGSNREDAQFCATCGAPLTQRCPSCGATPTNPEARFCDRCGAELAPAAAAERGPAPTQARKVVTVLFADLVGSTAAQDQVDPEAVRRWTDRYYAALRAVVEGHGGRVVKFIGDGVMAVFGVPDVREDDAPRALAAAVALHDAMQELGAGPGGGTGMGLRIGVNTGEVVVSEDDDDVVGDVVNVAARLEQAAVPGQVLVGETTFRLVRLGAQLRAVPPLELKGKPEPVKAFLLVGLGARTEGVAQSPFVGRASELERLTALLDACMADRRPHLASVVGSPGVGKTRLTRELAAAAAERARVVDVRCDPAGGATFAPIATALRAAASLDDDATDETVRAALTALFDDAEPDRDRVATIAAALLGVGEPGSPEETFWAVRRLVENAARVRPIVFVFDDVHWAEPLLLDLIENLAAWMRDVPVLLVVTARPELRDLRPALVEAGGSVSAAIHLEGLQVDESRRLTRALLDGAALPERLLDRIATASEGNPLFVGELVRMLVDDGALRRDRDRWVATVDLADLEVPPSIHALLAARIDRLSAGERAVLEAASVIGKTFYRGAVAELVGPEVQPHLDEHLEGLRRKEMVEPAGTYWIDEPVLRFHHVLIRDAAYRRLLKEARAELHERAAAWLDAKVTDLAEHDDVVGFQLEQAHLLRSELGESEPQLGSAAADRLAAAGRRALEADDRSAAASLLGRALDCLPAEDDRRADLLIDRCEALLAMGDVTDAAPAVADLAAVAAGSPRIEAWVTCFNGEIANLRDPRHLAATADATTAAAEVLAGIGDDAGEAKAHAVRAASLARLGRIAECERALDRALASARRAGDRRRATAILAGAPTAALWGPNPVTRASGRCLDVVRVLRITSRAPAVEATSLRCQAVLEALRGRASAARRMLASARTSLEELGHLHGLLEVDMAAGMVETLAGDLGAAEAHLRRAHEGFHALGIDVDAGLAAALLARVRIGQRRATEALELTVESERLAGDDLKAAISWRAVRAEALAHQGDFEEAQRLAEEAVGLAGPTDALVDHADALLSLAEVRRSAGDAAGAADAARQALELYQRKEATVSAERARRYLSPPAATLVAGAGQGEGTSSAPEELSNLALRTDAAMIPLVLEERWDELRPLARPDIAIADHRTVIRGLEGSTASGVDEWIAAVGSLVEAGVDEITAHPIAIRGDLFAVYTGTWGGRAGTVDAVGLIEIDEAGLVKASDVYDLDSLQEAVAEMDHRYAATLDGVDAAVFGTIAAMMATVTERDWATLADLLTDDLEGVDHRQMGWGVLDKAGYIELYRSTAALTPDVWFGVAEVLAVTEAGACVQAVGLGTTTDGSAFQTAGLAVYGVRDGRIGWIEWFPPDREDLGLACLAHRGSDRQENLALRVSRQIVDALFADRWDEIVAQVAPDIGLADHRPLFATAGSGLDTYLVLLRALREIGVTSWDVTAWIARGDRLVLTTGTMRGATAETELVQLLEVDDEGRLSRVDAYDADQLAEATAELERRWAGWGDAAESYEPVNAATVAAREIADLGLAGRWEEAAARMRPDITWMDHRAIVGGIGGKDRDEYLEVAHGVIDSGVQDVQARFRAVRGERLALGTGLYLGRRAETEVVAVVEFDDEGLAKGLALYDLDELAAAQADLEARYAEELGPELGAVWLACTPIFAGMVAHDWAGMRATLAEHFVLIDHRSLGWGTVTREEFIELYRVPSAPDIWFGAPEVFEVTRSGVCCRGEGRGTTADGAEFRTGALMVLRVTGGRIAGAEYFALDHLDDALACLHGLDEDEAVATLGGGAGPQRWASSVLEEFLRHAERGDVEATEAMFSATARVRDHRLVVGGYDLGNGVRALVETCAELTPMQIDWTALAWRGERFELGRVRFSSARADVEAVALVEIDEDGRIATVDTYDVDDLSAAVDRLDELYRASSPGTPVRRAVERLMQLLSEGDVDGLKSAVSPTAELDDRRRIVGGMFDLGDAGGEGGVFETLIALSPRMEWTTIEFRGDRFELGRVRASGPNAVAEGLVLAEVDGEGRIHRVTGYDLDELDQAVADLDERFRRSDGLAGDAGNAAVHTFDETMALVMAGRIDEATALYEREVLMHDHRPIIGGVSIDGRDEAMEMVTAMWQWEFDRVRRQVLDQRGDRLVLLHAVLGNAGSEIEVVVLLGVAEDGRVRSVDLFEPDQVEAARSVLDSRADELAAEGHVTPDRARIGPRRGHGPSI